jgi:hypothetical protein
MKQQITIYGILIAGLPKMESPHREENQEFQLSCNLGFDCKFVAGLANNIFAYVYKYQSSANISGISSYRLIR